MDGKVLWHQDDIIFSVARSCIYISIYTANSPRKTSLNFLQFCSVVNLLGNYFFPGIVHYEFHLLDNVLLWFPCLSWVRNTCLLLQFCIGIDVCYQLLGCFRSLPILWYFENKWLSFLVIFQLEEWWNYVSLEPVSGRK